MPAKNIVVDTGAIIKVLLIIALFGVLYMVRDIILFLFIGYIIMSAINPLVSYIEKKGFPRWIATLFVYFLILIIIGGFFAISFTPLVVQVQVFMNVLPSFLDRIINEFNLSVFGAENSVTYLQGIFQTFSSQIAAAPSNIWRFGAGIFGGFLDMIMVFIFAFYLTLERKSVHTVMVTFTPYTDKRKLRGLIDKVETKLGAWMRGQITLMFLIGVMTFIGLQLIGVPYALPLAVIAGFMEIIPIVGPIVSAIPAILVGLVYSPVLALSVVFLYILIQQLENSIVVPRLMRHAVGLDPLIVIIALMVGGRLAGPLGALLSVPAAAVLKIIYHEWGLDVE